MVVFWPNFSTLSGGKLAGMSGGQMGPGATLLARIFFSGSCCEIERM
jgi:hypothetical protein